MAQYRRKVTYVEANQFFYDRPRVPGVFYSMIKDADGKSHAKAYVITIYNQRVYLEDGDWIIAEPDDIHHYPCKDDIFKTIYEKVG